MSEDEEPKLTHKQEEFVKEWLRSFNATKAALVAGYSADTARSIGCENLTKPNIKAAISARIDTEGITEERIKSELGSMAFDGDAAEIEAYVRAGVSLVDLREMGFNTKLVKSISESVTAKGTTRKAEMYDRQSALEKLGKVLAMFTDKHVHDVGDDTVRAVVNGRMAKITDKRRGGASEGAVGDSGATSQACGQSGGEKASEGDG